MHAILRNPPTPKDHASALKAAYEAGYADAVILLRARGDGCVPSEPIDRIQARYLGYMAMKSPTEEGRAYVAGFGDAAADNLPRPSHAFEDHQIAA